MIGGELPLVLHGGGALTRRALGSSRAESVVTGFAEDPTSQRRRASMLLRCR